MSEDERKALNDDIEKLKVDTHKFTADMEAWMELQEKAENVMDEANELTKSMHKAEVENKSYEEKLNKITKECGELKAAEAKKAEESKLGKQIELLKRQLNDATITNSKLKSNNESLQNQLHKSSQQTQNLQRQVTKLETTERTEHILLEKDEAKIKILEKDLHEQQMHDKELEDVDKFLHSISTNISDDELTDSIAKLVEEYLVYCDYRNTVDCLTSERKCVRFKPRFSYNSEKSGVERAHGIKMSLLKSFDNGEIDPFMATWIANVPPALLSNSKLNKVLHLKLNIHFALYVARGLSDATSLEGCERSHEEGSDEP